MSDTGGRSLSPVRCVAAMLVLLAGCTPPTDVIDLSNAPLLTLDAMVQVPALPLGVPPPPGVGSVGPISGYGCAESPTAASNYAVQQLKAKALRMHATAVVDVMVASSGTGLCALGYGTTASGIAVAPRGVPPSY